MKTRTSPLNGNAARRARQSFVLKALPAAVALVFAQASGAVDIAGGAGLPQNGTVFSGSATGSVSGNQLTVNQSTNRAVIDWTSFNIDAGKAVQFVQPGVSSAVLNRINGDASPTQILGSLSANGTVMLMNPNGVMFGANSVVNVGSLIATTGTIDVNNFNSTGGALITGATGGSITNQGTLTAQNAGLIALVAPSVINQGSIVATGGTVALAGATAATVSLNGGLYEFAIPAGATGTAVTNAAGASLKGASILLGVGDAANLVSGVINLEGVQQASNRIVVNGDSVVLKSALDASAVSGNSNTVNVSGAARIQDGVNIVKSGGAVNVAAGTYVQSKTLKIDKSLTLSGAGEADTIIDAQGVTNYGMHVTADNVTLKNFTLYGPSANVSSSYGIKVAPSGGASARLRDFAINNVTIRGSGRAELDLNGVVGAMIDHVTADGAPVANAAGSTQGAGIQITDSASVQVINSTTLNNAWGGLALYQSNRSYDQQTDLITIGGGNHFTERNPVFMQDESASKDFGLMSIAGFDFVVRNPSATNNAFQYTWLQTFEQQALDFAVNLGASTSYVQAWNGATALQDFRVGVGNLLGGGTQALSIGSAIGAASSGATVHVAAGTYSENVTINKALTLSGAGSTQTIIKAPSSASGTAVTVSNASNVTLSDLQIADSFYGLQMTGTSNHVTVDRVAFSNNSYGIRNGTAVRADNFIMRNSTVTGGLVGVQAYNNASNGASFANALFENVTIDGPSYKGFYFETADNLTLRNVTIANAGNVGEPTSHQNGSAIDINLKYGAFNAITFDNVVVKNSGHSSGSAGSAAVVIKTRGIPGDTPYSATPASLQSVNITGGSIEGSNGTGIRFETLGNGSGGQPTVRVSGTQFKDNGTDIAVDGTNVDARGAVFVGAADGFAVEDRVTHALDTTGRGLVTWDAGNVYVTQNSGSIQRGVDAAGSGDTVNVANASFAENVTVNARRDLAFNDTRLQSLTLGSGAAGSGIGGKVTAEGAGGFNVDKTASLRLLSDTTLATNGADINLNGDIQNAGGVARNLGLVAGSGAVRGNVHMNTGGLEAATLGKLDVKANNFGLDSTLWVGAYNIDASGNVALSGHTLRAQDAGAANAINAGGDVSGSTINVGNLQIASGGDITANIAGNNVAVQAVGNLDVVVNAAGSAALAGNAVVASVAAPVVTVQAQGNAQISGASPNITVNAPSGQVTGNFGQVTNTGGGLVNVNGKPQTNQTLSNNLEISRVLPNVNAPADSAASGQGNGAGGVAGLQLASVELTPAQSNTQLERVGPESAGDAVSNGDAVEIDLTPRNEREKKKTN